MAPKPSESGWPMEKTTSKDTYNHHQKQQRSPDAVQQHVIDPAAILDRQRRAIAGAAAHLCGPGVGAGGIAQHRQGQRLGGGALGLLVQKERNGFQSNAMHGADLRYWSAQFAGQFQRVHMAARGRPSGRSC